MYILLIFAFLAGLVTALSPCILPVLPLLLSAGIGPGRSRPYGIILGLTLSFTFFTLSLTALVHATGISPDFLRWLAIILISFFGLTMVFPQLEQWFSNKLTSLSSIGQSVQSQAEQAGSGFWSGFILGCALGLIWAPCAGPILAAISTLVATGSISIVTILTTFAYSLGTAVPMFLIMYGGNKITSSISSIAPYTELIRKIFGVLMVLGALAIAFHFDMVLQQIAIKYFPMVTIDDNALVKEELNKLRSESEKANKTLTPAVGNPAPEFVEISQWFNSPMLYIEKLKGNVVLVDFWTYSCINCVRTLPYLKDWYQKYKDKKFIIVGIHTPEFEFEKKAANVENAMKRFGITYPVGLDNQYATWQNYHNHYWPAHYLIDKDGIIQEIHFGEGHYLETENAIRKLLDLEPISETKQEPLPSAQQSPETYLGYARARNYTSEIGVKKDIATAYNYTKKLENDEIGLKGTWIITPEYIKSAGEDAQLDFNFIGNRVYLVMSTESSTKVTILLDGKPLPATYYTKDMDTHGSIMINESRMYDILDLKGTNGRHTLTLKIPENVSLFAFTFGSGIN